MQENIHDTYLKQIKFTLLPLSTYTKRKITDTIGYDTQN